MYNKANHNKIEKKKKNKLHKAAIANTSVCDVSDNDMLSYSLTAMMCFFDKRMIWFSGLYW